MRSQPNTFLSKQPWQQIASTFDPDHISVQLKWPLDFHVHEDQGSGLGNTPGLEYSFQSMGERYGEKNLRTPRRAFEEQARYVPYSAMLYPIGRRRPYKILYVASQPNIGKKGILISSP